MRRLTSRLLLLIFFLPAIGAIGQTKVSGTFRPSGPPKGVVRTKVGGDCVVDLKQGYGLEGSLVGEMEIDFHIFISGDCTKAPGTFDENWISYGTYAIRVGDTEYTGALIYLAKVKAGGKVDGTLTLDGEFSADCKIDGNFADGYMSYIGVQITSKSH
jgi:hypothetical protein